MTRKCHYEVLEVERDVGDDDLKKAYRKLALKWHPDKNTHQVDVATERFKEIQAAHAVLSDPQERAWYDSHRESILRGGSGVAGDTGDGGDPDAGYDVWAFFSSSCYSGFGDDEDGFYAVYNKLFREITADEAQHQEGGGKAPERPPFGDSKSAWGEVKNFYGWWESFSTARLCASADQYDTRAAPNRQVRQHGKSPLLNAVSRPPARPPAGTHAADSNRGWPCPRAHAAHRVATAIRCAG